MIDPFRPAGLRVEFVDSAAGSGKTLTAIQVGKARVREEGISTIFVMPTLQLIAEMVEFAQRGDDGVPVVAITSGNKIEGSVSKRIYEHIENAVAPHLLFITHAAFDRMVTWPDEARDYHVIIDEAPEVILNRAPFQLRDSFYVLTSFLDTRRAPVSPAERRARMAMRSEGVEPFTERDQRRMDTFESILRPKSAASESEREQAAAHLEKLKAKKEAWNTAEAEHDVELSDYFQVTPKEDLGSDDPEWMITRRVRFAGMDDIYRYLDPLPLWLQQGCPVFTAQVPWKRMVNKSDRVPDRGRITLTGFRRPDMLGRFRSATIMSALFPHTMVRHVWGQLGVEFLPSNLIRLSEPTTPLGRRNLTIYWLTDQGWSKRARDKAGGIGAVLELIRNAAVIDPRQTVCVCVNKDDGSEENPGLVRQFFPGAVMMPHNSRGQNRFRGYHQLIHCAALNSYTPDIRWLETALGINSSSQRIARTGQEVYQTMMRLSLRDPTDAEDCRVVVMDKDVAEWLAQWFSPRAQVVIEEIDASGVIRKRLTAGRPKKPGAMTPAERQRRRRAKLRAEGP